MELNQRSIRSLGLLTDSRGLTVVELAMFAMIIGMLAAFAAPRFRNAGERSRARRAFNYLAEVQAAQERHHAQEGVYTSDLSILNIKLSAPRYFSIEPVVAGPTGSLKDSWTLTATRSDKTRGYGSYTVIFNQDGYDPTKSTIPPDLGLNFAWQMRKTAR